MNIIKRIKRQSEFSDKTNVNCGSHDDNLNFNHPLHEFNTFQRKLVKNDIIGVLLEKNEHIQVECKIEDFETIFKKEFLNKVPKVKTNYRHVEEHLFRVVKIKNQKIWIEPTYINSFDTAIHKNVSIRFMKSQDIPTKHITDLKLLIDEIPEYETIDMDFIEDLQLKFDKMTSKENKIPNKYFLDSYKNYVYQDKQYVKQFYDLLEKYKDQVEIWKSHHQLNNLDFGSYDQLIQYCLKIIQIKRQQPVTTISLSCNYDVPVTIAKCQIDFRKTFIKYSDVYRVYGYNPNSTYQLKSVDTICNWGGKIIDMEVLNHLKSGNIVRVVYWKTDGSQFSIYMSLLEKLSKYEFLASVENMYLSNFDDIVTIIDIRAIMEIPCNWFQNENLEKFDNGKDFGNGEKRGFHMTGNTYDHTKTITLETNWDSFASLLIEMDYDL